MNKETFLHFYSAQNGEIITDLKQITQHCFSGEELFEFVAGAVLAEKYKPNSPGEDKVIFWAHFVGRNAVANSMELLSSPKTVEDFYNWVCDAKEVHEKNIQNLFA